MRAFLFFFFFSSLLGAQVVVDLSLERPLYLPYEPLVATVTIKNCSEKALLLADEEHHPWLSFTIESLDDTPLPPNNPHNDETPILLPSKKTGSRSVNLTTCYPLGDTGLYRVRAVVYVPELHRCFSSPSRTFEIAQGRLIWSQEVGVPFLNKEKKVLPTASKRRISLLSHRNEENTILYLHIEDKDHGMVFCTHPLGPLMGNSKPEIFIDDENKIHLLQHQTPQSFVYWQISLDGKILKQQVCDPAQGVPGLMMTPKGRVRVVEKHTGG